MPRRLLSSVLALSLCLAGGVASLVWSMPGHLPPEVLVGARSWPIRQLDSYRLELAPYEHDVTVHAVEVQLTNGSVERRADLVYPDNTMRYLGALTQQLPDTPTATLWWRVGDNVYLLGLVDEAVPPSAYRNGEAMLPLTDARGSDLYRHYQPAKIAALSMALEMLPGAIQP